MEKDKEQDDEKEENIEDWMENGYENDPTQPNDHVKSEENTGDAKDWENKEGNNKPKEKEVDLEDEEIAEMDRNHDEDSIWWNKMKTLMVIIFLYSHNLKWYHIKLSK